MISKKTISYIDEVTDVLSIADAKLAGNIIRTDQDSDIAAKIAESIDWCSSLLGFSLRRAYVDYWFGNTLDLLGRGGYYGTFLEIPANVLSVEAVYYRDENHVEQTLGADDYEFINMGVHIPSVNILNIPNLSDRGYAYRVRIVEGYYLSGQGSVSDARDVLPSPILSAIKLDFVAQYENRTDTNIVETYKLRDGARARLLPFAKLRIL